MNLKSQISRLCAGIFFICANLCAEKPIVIRNMADAIASPHDNLKSGVPTFEGVIVYDRSSYAVGFSPAYRQPVWVQYVLTREEVQSTVAKRTDNFRTDPDIPGSLSPDAFKGTGYDRGHLAPAADMRWSTEAMSDSFLMTNMTPQHPACNRNSWLMLEAYARYLAERDGRVIVISGVFSFSDRKSNGLQIPAAFFKILKTDSELKAFIIPNRKAGLTMEEMSVNPALISRGSAGE